MNRACIICCTVLLGGILPAHSAPEASWLRNQSLDQLEQRLVAIDSELNHLAQPSLRSGIGTLGYLARPTSKNKPIWMEIELDQAVVIDQIVLVPILWRDTQKGFQADSFPVEFRITIGTPDQPGGTLLGEYRPDASILAGVAPLILPANGVTASWVRIDVTRLSYQIQNNRPACQLSEILIFSGETNVALRRPVKTPPYAQKTFFAWNSKFLTDGLMPYIMDGAETSQSDAYVCLPAKNPELTLDLGQPTPLNRIHLHTVDQGNTAPPAIEVNRGFPKSLTIEGSSLPDFSDAIPLLKFEYDKPTEIGPIMMWNIPETTCRYIRISTPSPFKERLGFTEIELFSGDQNVALNKLFTFNKARNPHRSLSALTDGLNFYGQILPIRAWLNQLARRHELETERPLVINELNARYARQQDNLSRMYWLTALLLAITVFTILISRNIGLRQTARVKERLAANLHDELGANIHSISILNSMARNSSGSPEITETAHRRIEELAEQTATAVQHCTNLLGANELYSNLVADMHRESKRITTNIKHDLSIEGETFLERLKPNTSIDLFLFYKECLVNICRHAHATAIHTILIANKREIVLSITDNGIGISSQPKSLKRRARLLKAKLSVENPTDGGTCITLRLRNRRGTH